MERGEYLSRARELALRGQDLPQAKLLDLDIAAMRSAARQRDALKKHIKDNLSNEALAIKFGVSLRTVERVMSYETWSHVA